MSISTRMCNFVYQSNVHTPPPPPSPTAHTSCSSHYSAQRTVGFYLSSVPSVPVNTNTGTKFTIQLATSNSSNSWSSLHRLHTYLLHDVAQSGWASPRNGLGTRLIMFPYPKRKLPENSNFQASSYTQAYVHVRIQKAGKGSLDVRGLCMCMACHRNLAPLDQNFRDRPIASVFTLTLAS